MGTGQPAAGRITAAVTPQAWTVPAIDDAAGRLAAAIIAQRGHTTPAAAVALFREVRELLLAEPATPVA